MRNQSLTQWHLRGSQAFSSKYDIFAVVTEKLRISSKTGSPTDDQGFYSAADTDFISSTMNLFLQSVP